MLETSEPISNVETEKRRYDYDAIVVLGGGLHKEGEKFYPTDYREADSDPFGMLGAGMRIVAATELYLQGKANNFVFTTGVTDKNKEKFKHEVVPTEASVYQDKFERMLHGLNDSAEYHDRFANLEDPNILLEDRSNSTLTNIQNICQMILDNHWLKVAIVSSDYHIPRVSALYEQALPKLPELDFCQIKFISAENYVKETIPGKYDEVIDRYYNTPQALERIKNEQEGLKDIEAGRYALGEFQLTERNPASDQN